MSALEQRSPQELLVDEVRKQNVREQILAVLPQDVPFASFERAAIRALLTNTDLVKAERRSLFRALVDCAYMGLVPDGKHAALVIYGNQCQALPMVAGIITAASSYGWHMRANVVHANDTFESSDEPQSIRHAPARPGTDKGELVAAYAIAVHRDGRRQQIVMDKEAVEKRQAKARTKNIWNEWRDEMWKKTAAHRLFKELPLDEADKRVARLLADELEPGQAREILYRPGTFGEVPAGVPRRELSEGSPVVPQPADSVPPVPSAAGDAGSDTGAEAPSAPVSAPDPFDEPGPEPEQSPPPEDAEQLAALEAAKFNPGSSKWPGKNIGQIYESGEAGRDWLRYCLEGGARRADFVAAVRAFARVFAPELWQAAVAREEAGS